MEYSKELVKRLLLISYFMSAEDEQAADDDYLFRDHHDDDETLLKLVLEIDGLREEDELTYDLVVRYKRIQNNT